MGKIIKKISVDVATENRAYPVVAKQFDSNSRFLTVQLTNDGKELTVKNTSTVLINALREDGQAAAFAGSVNDDGTVTVPLTTWMLELDGNVQCDISVITQTDSETRRLTSTAFNVRVDAATYAGDHIKEDENYDVLVSLINDCSQLMGELESIDSALDRIIAIQNNLIGGGN